MAPDEPANHTYLALGYEEKIAKKKARLNANLLQNRAKRGVEILTKEKNKSRFHVVEYGEEIIPNKIFQKMLIKIIELYRKDKHFYGDARVMTKEVIYDKLEESINMERAVDEGVNYLLKELAFVLASPEIYNTPHVTYIYHRNWVIFQKLIAGEYDGKPKTNLSFLLSNID